VNTHYDYRVDVTDGTAPARVVRMVGKKKRVLEIGAGPGSITQVLKNHSNCRITAIEIDTESIEKLSPFCEQVYRHDLNDIAWTNLLSDQGKFDVVVAADVLEHLYDPWSTLRALKNLLTDDGSIVISLPHVGHSAVIACLFDEDFDYRDCGLLDRTHIRFFGMKNIQSLFTQAGFKIIDAEFVIVSPEKSEFVSCWQNVPYWLKRRLAKHRFGSVYQVVIKAIPDPTPDKGLALLSIPVPMGAQAQPFARIRIVDVLKAKLRPYVGQRMRSRLTRALRKCGFKV
jgi:2-polyprenyl-3-methyl-5-hydroxy-6-metoxy-1,4-benzoquinol methylase